MEIENKIRELFQKNTGLSGSVSSMIGLGYGPSHPLVLEAYSLVLNLALMRGEDPIATLYYLDKSNFTSVVPRKNHTDYGPFFNMYEDLGNYIDNIHNTDNKLYHMSYAYARRYAAAGLFSQGIMDRNEYSHTYQIFISIQHQTDSTKNFQIEANNQAVEYVLSYSSKLTEQLINAFVGNMSNKYLTSLKDKGEWRDFDSAIELQKTFLDMKIDIDDYL